MNWFKYVANLLPTVLSLMALAEQAFSGRPKSGAQKKALVTTGAKAIVEGIATMSTGGQAETWTRISGPVSGIIDHVAAIAFPSSESKEIPAGISYVRQVYPGSLEEAR